MKIAKLHQLIELARQGKKFKATLEGLAEWLEQDDFKTSDSWSTKSILADWKYKEIREPEVVEFELDCVNSDEESPTRAMDHINYEKWKSLRGKKWSVVCTEVIE